MKKYAKPTVEKIEFEYQITTANSGCYYETVLGNASNPETPNCKSTTIKTTPKNSYGN